MLTEKEQRFLKSYTAAELRRLAKDLVAAADVVEAWAARRRQTPGKLRVAKSEIERFADEWESGLRCRLVAQDGKYGYEWTREWSIDQHGDLYDRSFPRCHRWLLDKSAADGVSPGSRREWRRAPPKEWGSLERRGEAQWAKLKATLLAGQPSAEG